MHQHNHSHDHSHHHAPVGADMNRAFVAGIVLNMAFVIVQTIAGFVTGSVALLSDAGHNLSDVASLVLSLIAFRLAKSKPTNSFTYGYKKTTILAALTNAVILLIAIGVLGYEAIHRLQHPQPVAGGIVAIVAAVGIVVNVGTAMFFFGNKEHDLNVKGAYLHMITDALVSLGVVIAGLLISRTGWYWLDGAVSIVILVVILIGTWSLLKDSLRLALDAVPINVTKEEVEKLILGTAGVVGMHHTHIWAMSTTQNALTTHLTLSDSLSFDDKMKLVHELKHKLLHNNIHHATIELESPKLPCEYADC
jgi:cobalt-zinc-cadmium efflux system protein